MNRQRYNPSVTKTVACGLVVVLCGCVSVRQPQSTASESKFAAEQNYTLNVDRVVSVGDSIVARKNYYYREVDSLTEVKALNDFEVRATVPLSPEFIRKGRKDEIFSVAGASRKQSSRIVLLGATSIKAPIALLVSVDTGKAVRVTWRNAFGVWDTTAFHQRIEPENTAFAPVRNVVIDKSKPYENCEIIFTGRSGQTATFLYREYSPDDLAKTAFFQNLSYNLEAEGTIQFKKIRIKILEMSNESIRFKVLSDL